MGKRSDFDRIEKDFYRTIDPNASKALNPFLPIETWYAEPCVGNGDLVDQLDLYGHICQLSGDIASGTDALSLTSNRLFRVSMIITNPPWSRPILHSMIEHFSSLKPTWLLFDADWMHTKQSSMYMRDLCTDVVSIGRLKWIPDTSMVGKDNCAWYKFDKDKNDTTKFHGR